ncbi:MAG: hypothetical protein JO266_20585 [Acidobacteria bacterium]|nr:hypothetical protein [Acidobacteriota bacterium]
MNSAAVFTWRYLLSFNAGLRLANKKALILLRQSPWNIRHYRAVRLAGSCLLSSNVHGSAKLDTGGVPGVVVAGWGDVSGRLG